MEENTGSNSQAPTNTGNAAISITGNGGDEDNSNEKKMNISTKELLIKVILPFFIVCLTGSYRPRVRFILVLKAWCSFFYA